MYLVSGATLVRKYNKHGALLVQTDHHSSLQESVDLPDLKAKKDDNFEKLEIKDREKYYQNNSHNGSNGNGGGAMDVVEEEEEEEKELDIGLYKGELSRAFPPSSVGASVLHKLTERAGKDIHVWEVLEGRMDGYK